MQEAERLPGPVVNGKGSGQEIVSEFGNADTQIRDHLHFVPEADFVQFVGFKPDHRGKSVCGKGLKPGRKITGFLENYGKSLTTAEGNTVVYKRSIHFLYFTDRIQKMKVSNDLIVASKPEWLTTVMDNFDSFLQDHADCERKASGMAMSLVAKYPDRRQIIPLLIETAIEELEHFAEVVAVMDERGVPLPAEMKKDPYITALLALMDNGIENRFLDRLLVASVVECRGAERFRLIYLALPPGKLKDFYHRLWASEAKHGNIFTGMALTYFESDRVYRRLDQWIEMESKVVDELEIRAALH